MNARRFFSIAGTTAVTAIAAAGSYDHMRMLAVSHGQNHVLAALEPLSVDGMLLVASLALGDGRQRKGSAWLAFVLGIGASLAANVMATPGGVVARVISAWPAVALLLTVEILARSGKAPAAPAPVVSPVPAPVVALPTIKPAPAPKWATVPADVSTLPIIPATPPAIEPAATEAKRPYKPIAARLAEIAQIRETNPDIELPDLAARIGLSAKRTETILRTAGLPLAA